MQIDQTGKDKCTLKCVSHQNCPINSCLKSDSVFLEPKDEPALKRRSHIQKSCPSIQFLNCNHFSRIQSSDQHNIFLTLQVATRIQMLVTTKKWMMEDQKYPNFSQVYTAIFSTFTSLWYQVFHENPTITPPFHLSPCNIQFPVFSF